MGNTSLGFLDLHTHVLPGVDDGPATPREAKALLEALGAIGFDTVCATPHQKADQFLPSHEEIRSALSALRQEISGADRAPRLVLGAENMWDACFYERFESRTIPCYDSSPAFLLEFPPAELPPDVARRLFELRATGLLPVVAHPERYLALRDSRAAREELAGLGVLVVNLTAVAGHHGRHRAKLARSLIRDGHAHAAASDAHVLADVAQAADGVAWIRKKLGDGAVVRLLDENPRRILAGEHPGD